MYCHQCGKELGSHAKFCPHCGAKQPESVHNTAAESSHSLHDPLPVLCGGVEQFPIGEPGTRWNSRFYPLYLLVGRRYFEFEQTDEFAICEKRGSGVYRGRCSWTAVFGELYRSQSL